MTPDGHGGGSPDPVPSDGEGGFHGPASDQLVTAGDVLHAVMRLRRRGRRRELEDLERQEPDLCEFLLEESTAAFHAVLDLGVPAVAARRLHRRVESMALTLALAQRRAWFRLWRDDAAGTRLAAIDPSLDAAADGREGADAPPGEPGEETGD